MSELKISERVALLRRQRGVTQEELASALGVTNQSVSKWESGQCCPDIGLLPDLAAYFGVTTDELLGCETAETPESVYMRLRAMFEALPEREVFEGAFRVCAAAHEAACTGGYRRSVPWDTGKNYALTEELHKWGFSVCSLPEGNTARAANAMFIACGSAYRTPTLSEQRDVLLSLERLCYKNVLLVLYALYALTAEDFDLYVPLSEIARAARLSESETDAALGGLPVTVREDESGNALYRLEGSYMHIPSLLLLLRER